MVKHKQLTREVIIQALAESLKSLDYIHAFWEGGAAAYDRIDEWSDIDLYLIVDNGKVNEAFLAVENALKSLSPLKQKFRVPQSPWPGVFQAFYKIEGASDYLAIDLAILTPNSSENFLEPRVHGKAVFYIKHSTVELPRLDKNAFMKRLQRRLENLKTRFEMFNNFIQKEINRGNSLEAVGLYYGFTLGVLVEALRIKYYPIHFEFRLRYVHYEFPLEIIEKLKNLYLIADINELQGKYSKASEWFNEIISAVDLEEVERLVEAA